MGLIADKLVFLALKNGATIMTVDGRVFNTVRPERLEKEDKLPYCIIVYEGMTPEGSTKDAECDNIDDRETVSVTCVADTREALATLAQGVRRDVADYIGSEAWEAQTDVFLYEYSVTAGSVACDTMRPCFWQALTFQFVTTPGLE